MSKLLKILGLGCTGGFSDSPDLQARFAAWIVFTCISIGGFVFDAWISESVFGDYLAYVGGSGRWPGLMLSVCFAMAATSAVNVVAYAFVSYRRKSMLQESISDSLRFAGYVAGFLYLTFALVSLLANIQGADNAAERSAQAAAPVDDSQITAVTKKWTAEKEKAEARYDGELAKLNARIDAIEDGSSTEKAYDKNGKRGAVLWQGNKTPYGYALLEELNVAVTAKQAERTEALAALDDTYQKRLDAEQAAFNRTEAKYTDKKERSSTAIRMIVFLVYPIALLIAIFNAHFLYEATLYIKGEEDDEEDDTTAAAGSVAPAPMATPVPSAAPSPMTSTSPAKGQIGFRTGAGHQARKEDVSFDQEAFKAELLQELSELLKRKNVTDTPVKGDNLPPMEFRFSTTHQPDKSAPKKHGKRADSVEARTAILATYRALKSQGVKPTYQAISEATKYSVKTVGNHVRELKREKVL